MRSRREREREENEKRENEREWKIVVISASASDLQLARFPKSYSIPHLKIVGRESGRQSCQQELMKLGTCQ